MPWTLLVEHRLVLPADWRTDVSGPVAQVRADILELKAAIMKSQTELAADLQAVADNVAKIGGETRTLIDQIAVLQDALANAGATSPEVDAALAALQDQVAVVDALVPDAP